MLRCKVRCEWGIEATGYKHWFEGLLAELGHELWMGDAAKIGAMRKVARSWKDLLWGRGQVIGGRSYCGCSMSWKRR